MKNPRFIPPQGPRPGTIMTMAPDPRMAETAKAAQRDLINRAVGAVSAPSPTMANAERATDISTFFARPSPDGQIPIIYNGDRQYAQVTLTLETAGPVAVGTKPTITPVLSGKGALLMTGIPMVFTISKGSRLWVAATSLNRIKVMVQPVPWAEQQTGILEKIASRK